jgi:hypothetical protein
MTEAEQSRAYASGKMSPDERAAFEAGISKRVAASKAARSPEEQAQYAEIEQRQAALRAAGPQPQPAPVLPPAPEASAPTPAAAPEVSAPALPIAPEVSAPAPAPEPEPEPVPAFETLKAPEAESPYQRIVREDDERRERERKQRTEKVDFRSLGELPSEPAVEAVSPPEAPAQAPAPVLESAPEAASPQPAPPAATPLLPSVAQPPLPRVPILTADPVPKVPLPNQRDVKFKVGGDQKEVAALLQKMFGSNRPANLAAAVNAQEGMTTQLGIDKWKQDALTFSTKDPQQGFTADRTLSRDQDDKLVMHNDFFGIEDTLPDGTANPMKGQGAKIFADQVKALQQAGVDRIETNAGRTEANKTLGIPEMSGYDIWAKMGYDGPIPETTMEAMPAEMKTALGEQTNVQSLRALPGGKEFWKEHGDTFEGQFDLAPDSPSLQILDTYLADRRQREEAAAAAPKPPAPPEPIPSAPQSALAAEPRPIREPKRTIPEAPSEVPLPLAEAPEEPAATPEMDEERVHVAAHSRAKPKRRAKPVIPDAPDVLLPAVAEAPAGEARERRWADPDTMQGAAGRMALGGEMTPGGMDVVGGEGEDLSEVVRELKETVKTLADAVKALAKGQKPGIAEGGKKVGERGPGLGNKVVEQVGATKDPQTGEILSMAMKLAGVL